MPKWIEGKVVDIIEETPFVKRFFFQIEGVDSFDFKPGQFVTFDLPIGEKRLERWRSYSIASAPNGTNIFELCIVLKYDGKGTNYYFNEVKIGTVLTFKGPDGMFVFPQKFLEKPMVLICTGTGIAPFRSLIQYLKINNRDYHSIHLIFGARHQSDIIYRNELEELAKVDSRFSFDVVLSRDQWKNQGYVHNVYKERYTGKINDNNFFLCGWSQMIDDAVKILSEEMHCPKEQIFYELYG